MIRRGLAADREDAHAAIVAGRVKVGGSTVENQGSLVAPDQPVDRVEIEQPFVSRGGAKLEAALDRFGVDAAGRDALDAGAATGGFTDCLLRRGAGRVLAVDVGYGDLAWALRTDTRVHLFERTNIRDVHPGSFPFSPSLVVADLSFVSLRACLPALVAVAREQAEFVLLVKPQFEAARAEVEPGGVVRDPAVWTRAVSEVARACSRLGVNASGAMASPVRGPAGNVEFFLRGTRGSSSRLAPDIGAAIAEGLQVRAAS